MRLIVRTSSAYLAGELESLRLAEYQSLVVNVLQSLKIYVAVFETPALPIVIEFEKFIRAPCVVLSSWGTPMVVAKRKLYYYTETNAYRDEDDNIHDALYLTHIRRKPLFKVLKAGYALRGCFGYWRETCWSSSPGPEQEELKSARLDEIYYELVFHFKPASWDVAEVLPCGENCYTVLVPLVPRV